jgi:hypothetical protein
VIVLDEQLDSPAYRRELAAWYPGEVQGLPAEAHGIKDDCDLLRFVHQHRNAVLVTKNWSDFWDKCDGDIRICVLCLDVGNQDDPQTISDRVRQVLQLQPFRRQSDRNGLIIKATSRTASFYRRRSDHIRRGTFCLSTGRRLPLKED